MKETLTAKEWLERENNGYDVAEIASISMVMEQYANYRTKELENKTIEFRNKFKDVAMLKRIDEHFNIK